jgi:hypothetical protein
MNLFEAQCQRCSIAINLQTDAHRKETSVDKKVRYWHIPTCDSAGKEEALRVIQRAARKTC